MLLSRFMSLQNDCWMFFYPFYLQAPSPALKYLLFAALCHVSPGSRLTRAAWALWYCISWPHIGLLCEDRYNCQAFVYSVSFLSLTHVLSYASIALWCCNVLDEYQTGHHWPLLYIGAPPYCKLVPVLVKFGHGLEVQMAGTMVCAQQHQPMDYYSLLVATFYIMYLW